MNFQAVEQANGNLITMFGIITEFVGEGINQNSGKPWKKAKITDDTAKAHTVTLRGTPPTVALVGQRAQFSLSTYQGTYQGNPYTGYSGFWNSQAQVASQGSQATPQGRSQATQSTNSPQSKQDMPKIRSMALSYAKDLACEGKIEVPAILSFAVEYTAFIMSGLTNPVKAAQEIGDYYDSGQPMSGDDDFLNE